MSGKGKAPKTDSSGSTGTLYSSLARHRGPFSRDWTVIAFTVSVDIPEKPREPIGVKSRLLYCPMYSAADPTEPVLPALNQLFADMEAGTGTWLNDWRDSALETWKGKARLRLDCVKGNRDARDKLLNDIASASQAFFQKHIIDNSQLPESIQPRFQYFRGSIFKSLAKEDPRSVKEFVPYTDEVTAIQSIAESSNAGATGLAYDLSAMSLYDQQAVNTPLYPTTDAVENADQEGTVEAASEAASSRTKSPTQRHPKPFRGKKHKVEKTHW